MFGKLIIELYWKFDGFWSGYLVWIGFLILFCKLVCLDVGVKIFVGWMVLFGFKNDDYRVFINNGYI